MKAKLRHQSQILEESKYSITQGGIFVHFPTLCHVLCCLLNSGENFVLHIKQANVVLDLHLKWTTIFSSYYILRLCVVCFCCVDVVPHTQRKH